MPAVTSSPATTVRRLRQVSAEHLLLLADLLIDCVDGGASVSFMHPLSTDQALSFWQGVAAGLAQGDRALLVAEDAAGIVGTVQLILAQPENQPRRCGQDAGAPARAPPGLGAPADGTTADGTTGRHAAGARRSAEHPPATQPPVG